MPKENNKMQVDIDTLKKQNVNDLLSIKELYSKLEELGEKTSQIKYIDNTLVKKIKKEYEKLKKIILDENIQVQLDNKIDEFNIKLTNDIETINSQMDKNVNNINLKSNTTQILNQINLCNILNKYKSINNWETSKVNKETDSFTYEDNYYKLSTTSNKPRVISLPIELSKNNNNNKLCFNYKSNKDCSLLILIEQNNSKNFYNRYVSVTVPSSNEVETAFEYEFVQNNSDTRIVLRLEHKTNIEGYIMFDNFNIIPLNSSLYDKTIKSDDYTIYIKDFPRRNDEESNNDDTGRFQRILSLVKNSSKYYKLILEEQEEYYILSKLDFKNLNIEGNNSTFYLRYASSNNTDYCIKWQGGNICNLIVKGTKYNYGIEINGKSALNNVKFYNLNTAAKFNTLVDCLNCYIWENKVGILINGTECIVDNLHGSSVVGIDINGEGNRIVNCKIHGDGMDTSFYKSVCGIRIRGTRNTISNNYIDQNKVCGIWIDDEKSSWLSNGAEEITGAYGNSISNNFFYNNGHGVEDDNGSYDVTNNTYNISAHIFVKTNHADRVIKRHNIVNNIFDTGYFKGWDDSMSNTNTLSTISCIHIVGQNQKSIKNFIIDLNSKDDETINMLKLVNVTENSIK